MEIIDSQSRLQFNAAQGAGTYTFSVYARSDSPVNMRLRPSVDGVYDVNKDFPLGLKFFKLNEDSYFTL